MCAGMAKQGHEYRVSEVPREDDAALVQFAPDFVQVDVPPTLAIRG